MVKEDQKVKKAENSAFKEIKDLQRSFALWFTYLTVFLITPIFIGFFFFSNDPVARIGAVMMAILGISASTVYWSLYKTAEPTVRRKG